MAFFKNICYICVQTIAQARVPAFEGLITNHK